MQSFKKHPNWVGKHLTLNVGRSDKFIGDHDVLTGPQWLRFVADGFLVRASPKPEAKAAVAKVAKVATSDDPDLHIDLQLNHTKADLDSVATDIDLQGRSKLNKDDLATALMSEVTVASLMENYTKHQLDAVATEVDLSGRSKMNEEELATALAKEMGSAAAVALKSDELIQAAESAAAKESTSASKSPADKAAAKQNESKAGKTSTKK